MWQKKFLLNGQTREEIHIKKQKNPIRRLLNWWYSKEKGTNNMNSPFFNSAPIHLLYPVNKQRRLYE